MPIVVQKQSHSRMQSVILTSYMYMYYPRSCVYDFKGWLATHLTLTLKYYPLIEKRSSDKDQCACLWIKGKMVLKLLKGKHFKCEAWSLIFNLLIQKLIAIIC